MRRRILREASVGSSPPAAITPRQKSHLAASFVCVLGIGVAAVLVYLKREE